MPKEVIHLNKVEMPYQDRDGQVRGEVEVQLAIQLNWAPHAGSEVMLGVVGWPVNPPEGLETENFTIGGYFAQLDWAGLNRLIREARRARDSAYGKPE